MLHRIVTQLQTRQMLAVGNPPAQVGLTYGTAGVTLLISDVIWRCLLLLIQHI
jgi:hypothetical protein